MTGQRMPGGPVPRRSAVRAVSRPHDPQEREADRAADVVGRGGTVAGWSFGAVPLTATSIVHRQEAPKPKGEDEKLKEAALKAGEAALETKEGKAVKEQVLADPLVKTVTDAVSTTPGKVVAGAAIVGGVGALAATGKPLPFQAPAFPLDRITPGLSAKVTVEGPLNAPTFVGLTLTYREQGAKAKAKPDSIAADTARLRAQQEMFRPKSEKDAAKKAEQEMIDAWVRSTLPGLKSGVTLPLPVPTAPVEEKPVQRAPASTSTSAAQPGHAHVDDALASPGRPLDRSTRRSMEARFGYDFSRVRVHDDASAAKTAEGIDAAAFTVGDHIALVGGHSGTSERLLAHELAHVVQQGSRGARLQRKAEPAISAPSDPAEREADETADCVIAGLPATLRGTPGGVADVQRHEGDHGASRDDDVFERPELDGEESDQAASDIQASREAADPGVAPPGFSQSLAGADGGQALPSGPRQTLEAAFDTPFRHVRLHRGAAAGRMAASIGAEAFTSGSHVHLGSQAPDPSSEAGLRLLAHEMSHVRQQAATGTGQAGRVPRVVQRSRALYFSTLGKQPYFQYAAKFHADRAFPAPVRVSSVEELIEDLVKLPKPIENVRLVSHAVPAGIMLPLLRGGAQSLFPADLALQSQAALESELVTEHQTNVKTSTVTARDFHVVPRDWIADAYGRVAGDAATKQLLKAWKFPDTVAQGGDLETLMWWILDRELILAERMQNAAKGKKKMGPVFPGVPNRDAVAAILQRNADIYKDRVRDHLVARGYPAKGTPEDRKTGAAAAVADFVTKLQAVASDLIDARAVGTQFNFGQPTQRYGTVQEALQRGTFPNNVRAAKVAIPNAMPFEIRGCRIGQNPAWLELFRDFWGMGAGATKKKPDVSAPDLRHGFGGHSKTNTTHEYLEGKRGRLIMGGTSEFDSHIVHAK
ncbi:MAG: DUF4157 domain-containing protein [Candidatus Limnocylindria bacterium]